MTNGKNTRRNPGEELDETRFTFMASFMKQKYLEETKEVQENVRNRREEMTKEMEEGDEEGKKNLAYQKYLCLVFSF